MFKYGLIKVAAATPKISVGDIQHNKKEILSAYQESLKEFK